MSVNEIFLGEFPLTPDYIDKWVKYDSPIICQLGYIKDKMFHCLATEIAEEHGKEKLLSHCKNRQYTAFRFKYCSNLQV